MDQITEMEDRLIELSNLINARRHENQLPKVRSVYRSFEIWARTNLVPKPEPKRPWWKLWEGGA